MHGLGVLLLLTLLNSASFFALQVDNLHPIPGRARTRSHGGLGGMRPRSRQHERKKSKEIHNHVHRSVSRSHVGQLSRHTGDAPNIMPWNAIPSPSPPTILKSGLHRLDAEAELYFMVVVPEDWGKVPLDGAFPVILLFHQHDPARGAERMAELAHFFPRMMPRTANTHIQVTPSGFEGSWSTCGGASPRDDLTLIGSTLLNFLSSFSNVQPRFKLFGFSQGAAFVNRLLIENYDPRITDAVTCNNQLTEPQFHDGRFYLGGDDNKYTVPSNQELRWRRILQITGDADNMMPAYGGAGVVQVPTLSWEESIYRFAQAYGWRDEYIRFTTGDRFLNVSYFDGNLRAYNYYGLQHDLGGAMSLGVEWIDPFFADGESSLDSSRHGSRRKMMKKNSHSRKHGSPRASRKKTSSTRAMRKKETSLKTARHGSVRSLSQRRSNSRTLARGTTGARRKKHSSFRTSLRRSGVQKKKRSRGH